MMVTFDAIAALYGRFSFWLRIWILLQQVATGLSSSERVNPYCPLPKKKSPSAAVATALKRKCKMGNGWLLYSALKAPKIGLPFNRVATAFPSPVFLPYLPHMPRAEKHKDGLLQLEKRGIPTQKKKSPCTARVQGEENCITFYRDGRTSIHSCRTPKGKPGTR